EDDIQYLSVAGVQTCALPICCWRRAARHEPLRGVVPARRTPLRGRSARRQQRLRARARAVPSGEPELPPPARAGLLRGGRGRAQVGRAAWRERRWAGEVDGGI